MKAILTIISLVIIIEILVGCAAPQNTGSVSAPNPCPQGNASRADAPLQIPSLNGITKLGVFGSCIAESETVVFKDQVILVGNTKGFVVIYDWNTKAIISATRNLSGQFNSALVVSNRLYVFSTESPNLKMAYTDDLQNWSEWEIIFTTTEHQLYNTSVIYTEQDGFVMAYEIDGEPGQQSYSWKIATSPDMSNWTLEGTLFDLEYSACPVIRFVNGYYQVIYLVSYSGGPAGMVSVVARTKDFITYEKASTVFLAPSSGEGINASDVSLNEFNGQVYINYMDGNQGGWDDQMIAIYNGTMEQMFNQIWGE